MRLMLLAPLALVACATTGDSQAAADAEIARLIDGRVEGPAVDCIQQVRVEGLAPIGNRTLIARGGNRLWINRLPESCPSMRSDAIPVIRTFNGDYCRNDMVTPVSPGSIPGGSCRLGKFVPYDKR